ncbi:hypothetical protein [Methylobacterium brachythecii]|uniref:Uncharacterized protein n=1 Tax=Methylobacterium brachythecii TaxID=1176177 RepID=A0A7W6AG44_9HYPH|nr:hypothetical protein [Methylobacterium brachythecii]MBB3900840.1 hypothetical protein [Methylobacterium brachythecii]GLS46062.1 hypothetical protein GCM10007884_40530 [Methylobacterium brachythecii]
MGVVTIGLGAMLCGSGAVAHFANKKHHNETLLALGGFCFLLAGLFVTRSGHF